MREMPAPPMAAEYDCHLMTQEPWSFREQYNRNRVRHLEGIIASKEAENFFIISSKRVIFALGRKVLQRIISALFGYSIFNTALDSEQSADRVQVGFPFIQEQHWCLHVTWTVMIYLPACPAPVWDPELSEPAEGREFCNSIPSIALHSELRDSKDWAFGNGEMNPWMDAWIY